MHLHLHLLSGLLSVRLSSTFKKPVGLLTPTLRESGVDADSAVQHRTSMHFSNNASVSGSLCACACALTAWFAGSVHGHFDGAVVRGHLRRSSEHGDGQSEALSCSTATKSRSWVLFILLCKRPFRIICKTYFLSSHNNTSLVQPQIITGFRPAAAAFEFKLNNKKKKKKKPRTGSLLTVWLRVWFGLLRECLPDCAKELTARVYCSTRQALAPILHQSAERGRLDHAGSPALVPGSENSVPC